jgi:hypothetical protein
MNTANKATSLTRLRVLRLAGGIIAYGCLAAFLCLIGVQLYRWFREGEWTRIGITDGLRATLVNCCVRDGDTGVLANLVHWLDTPTDWFGWHRVLEVIPASIGLFAMSVLGNFAYIYGSDRIEDQSAPAEQAAA